MFGDRFVGDQEKNSLDEEERYEDFAEQTLQDGRVWTKGVASAVNQLVERLVGLVGRRERQNYLHA